MNGRNFKPLENKYSWKSFFMNCGDEVVRKETFSSSASWFNNIVVTAGYDNVYIVHGPDLVGRRRPGSRL